MTINGTNGNGGVRGLLVYLSLIVALVALARPIFFAGGEEARIEEHLKYTDARLDSVESRQQKEEDKLEPEIVAMKESYFEDQQIIAQQKEFILELRQDLGKRR